jgi:hypothetical protein
MESKKKTREDALIFTGDNFKKLILELQSCEEAVEVFPEMYLCPVCGNCVDREGFLVHKDLSLLVN